MTSGARAGSPEVAIPASETVPGLVTVAIPARNESASIRRVLDAVRSQTYPDLQIVVVDGSSEDDTAAIVADVARSDPRVELVANPDRVIPRAMNLALAHARGEWFVRVDAHCRICSSVA